LKSVTVDTCAKVNFCLRVLGRRTDGYHEIETVLHTIGLWDRIHLSPLPEEAGIELQVSGEEVPADESNLCWQAARLFLERTACSSGVALSLHKSIPAGAGLGGGSSDAAATLAGLSRLFQPELASRDLGEMAAELGADAPFFLRGGCCLARGRGEKLSPLPDISAWLVLVVPERRVPTAQAYAALARGLSRGRHKKLSRAVQRAVAAVKAGDVAALAQELHNDFEAAAMAGIAEALEAKAALADAGCLGVSLSGSGSAVFGIAPDREAAARAADQVAPRWSQVAVVPTVAGGESLLPSETAEAGSA
jgi:4-diphosphocytidyl-2-C-methyl-D-erythritol kinase